MFNNNTHQQLKEIFSENGQIIGWIDGNAFCKKVKASKHMLRIPRGWAWDVFVLERARNEGLDKTIIYEKERHTVHCLIMRAFWQHGVYLNRGYGEQICLPLKFWQVSNKCVPLAQQLTLPI